MSTSTEAVSQPVTTEDGDLSIERDIRQFVATKTGERVYLYLGQESAVSIKHVRKSGSTVLAIFWLKVFQHQNNYPLRNFSYRKLYRSGGHTEDHVVLLVDGVKVHVMMTSGTLKITGTYALEWFVDRFRSIMAAYASPVDQPQTLRDIFTLDQRCSLVNERQRIKDKYRESWPDEALKESVNVIKDGNDVSKKITQTTFELLPDMLTDDHVYIHSDPQLLSPDDLSAQIERLSTGTILEGHTLYCLWKSLLNQWFSDENMVVYIVAPHIDADRLADICRLYLNNRLTANLGAVCVPMTQANNTKTSAVKREVILRFEPKDQVLIEYKIFESIVYPQKNYQAKFVACVKDESASILLTTADFHADHFLSSCSDTAVYQTLTEVDFMKRYLGPILYSGK